MKKNYNGTQCITFCNDGTAAHGNGPFKKPQSDILVRMRDYDNFVHLEAEPEDWSPCHCYPTKEVPGRLISYFFNEWLFIPDYSEEEQTQASHPSPNKGKPVYGTFGEEYEKSVRPYTDLIGAVRGIVRCTEAMEWAERMEQEQEALAEEMGIKAYKGLLPRAIQSAFFRAVMVYLMEGCQWTDEVEQFATWSLENDIWCKWYLFGSQLIEAQEREDAIIHSAPRMKSRTLEMLPPSFTRDDMHQAYAQQQKTKDAADVMLRQWKRRNLIRFDEQTNLFIKIA